MEIKGKVHCFFEQSGTFKNEFKKLGYEAYDYDIQNNFNETDHVIDLFREIEEAYRGGQSVFDTIGKDDLIIAFFPCIYFCANNELFFMNNTINFKGKSAIEVIQNILERSQNRQYFYELLLKLFGVCEIKQLRLVFENPYSSQHFLHNNFPYEPKVIDKNRQLRGDYYKKPTQYWFLNCEPTKGCTIQETKQEDKRRVAWAKSSEKGGLCSEERSLIHPDYSRNFICDFILGKSQPNICRNLFD